MSRIDSWSEAERAILKAHYLTKADKEIETILLAAGFQRTSPSVKNERGRRGWKRQTRAARPFCIEGWADWEVAILHDNPTASDRELGDILRDGGAIRTRYAVASKRRDLGLFKKPGDPTQSMARAGWPTMRGGPKERDELFWKAVLRHAVECGEIIIMRAA